MIKKCELPEDFKPRFSREFQIFGRHVFIAADYSISDPKVRLEKFFYAIYEDRQIIESGVLEWDPANGMLMLSEVAKVVASTWDHNS